MAFVAGLEAHLRMISTEAKRKYPIAKDAAKRAMFQGQIINTSRSALSFSFLVSFQILVQE
jgi:hypothetical protein